MMPTFSNTIQTEPVSGKNYAGKPPRPQHLYPYLSYNLSLVDDIHLMATMTAERFDKQTRERAGAYRM